MIKKKQKIMKIPLPAGNFIYFGKQNKEIQLTKKSADLVRDDHGSITGSVPSFFIFYCNLFEVVVRRGASFIRR